MSDKSKVRLEYEKLLKQQVKKRTGKDFEDLPEHKQKMLEEKVERIARSDNPKKAAIRELKRSVT